MEKNDYIKELFNITERHDEVLTFDEPVRGNLYVGSSFLFSGLVIINNKLYIQYRTNNFEYSSFDSGRNITSETIKKIYDYVLNNYMY